MTLPSQAYQQWLATTVRRWHTNPALSHTIDPVGTHSARVTILLLHLEPNVSREALIYALQHDLAELLTGDIAYPAKRDNPEFYQALKALEKRANEKLDITIPSLTVYEFDLINICDRLDSYMWALNHVEQKMALVPEWDDMWTSLRQKANKHPGLRDKIDALMTETIAQGDLT